MTPVAVGSWVTFRGSAYVWIVETIVGDVADMKRAEPTGFGPATASRSVDRLTPISEAPVDLPVASA